MRCRARSFYVLPGSRPRGRRRPPFGLAECRCGWRIRVASVGEADAGAELHNAGVAVVHVVDTGRQVAPVTALHDEFRGIVAASWRGEAA